MVDELNITKLIAASRAGKEEAKAELLVHFREYLRLLAHLHITPLFNAKFDESDVVQETCMQAAQSFDQFRGDNALQFAAWLRQIMANKGASMARTYLTQKRNAQLELRLQHDFDKSSMDLAKLIPDCNGTPSSVEMRRERSVRLADAIARIGIDQRDVLMMHGLQGLSVPEVAKKLGRTEASIWKLWARGLQALRKTVKDEP